MARELKLYHRYIYQNYAHLGQDVFGGYNDVLTCPTAEQLELPVLLALVALLPLLFYLSNSTVLAYHRSVHIIDLHSNIYTVALSLARGFLCNLKRIVRL
jgi:hypothetical protein